MYFLVKRLVLRILSAATFLNPGISCLIALDWIVRIVRNFLYGAAVKSLGDLVFQNLRKGDSSERQICLVDVAGDSVAVFPFNRRIEEIRSISGRKGFFLGFLVGSVTLMLLILVYSKVGGHVSNMQAKIFDLMFSAQSAMQSTDREPAAKLPAFTFIGNSGGIEEKQSPANTDSADRNERRVLLNLKDESAVLKESADRLGRLGSDEKLIFVGAYASYAAALSPFGQLFAENDALLVKSVRGANRSYLVLVRYAGDSGDFEKFRSEISKQLSLPLLKWNRASRYKALLS